LIYCIAADITERKREEARLAAQYAVTRVLSEELTLANATPRILQAICECLDWSVGAIWRVDQKEKLLRTFLVGAGVRHFGSIGTPVALTSIAFAIGLLLTPFGAETRGQPLPQ
jgi:hypothetical protein